MTDIVQKTRDDYNKIAKHFSGTRYDVWPELIQFKPIIQDGQYILDWGCGNGRLLLMLADKDINYFGLDQSCALLKIARKKYAAMIKKGVAHFYCTAHKEKIFPAAYFDLVFLIASFHHLPDKKSRNKLLKKIHGEIKPEGKLVIIVWNLDSDWAKNKLRHDCKIIGDGDYLIPWKSQEGKVEAERYYHGFSEEELKELLQANGFAVERIGYFGREWTDKKQGKHLIAVATR